MVCHHQSISDSFIPLSEIRIDPVEEGKFLVELRQDSKVIPSEDDKEAARAVPFEHRTFDQGPSPLNKFDKMCKGVNKSIKH